MSTKEARIMRYISLFSGIEAASCAWETLGWGPIAFSEIDKFPSAVLQNHYPEVPNLGDITKIDWSSYVGSADIVVGGSPCQSFSVAGSRTGLAGASGLMWEYVRAVRAIRPQWFVWENVPGALSSSHGEDFRCLLESMDDLGYGLAWRVLDAQFFGVAQRRRRVFLVGHLGDRRAAEVLFERESVQWYSASSREKRQALTQRSESSARTSGVDCLTPWDTQARRAYCAADSGYNAAVEQNLAPTLTAHDAKSTSYVSVPSTLQIRSGKDGGGKGALVAEDMSATLTCGVQQTLFPGNSSVRRFTPMECERLQGFPDGWTDIPYRGKPYSPDSARYKALGNSMCVPVMAWIAKGIQEVEEGFSDERD